MGTTAIKLGDLVAPSDADKYVVEDSVIHLTWDLVAWVGSVQATHKLVRLRYEWEKLIEKSHGTSMFLELTYIGETEFPCSRFYFYPVYNWVVHFVDFIELNNKMKIVIRLTHKDDIK